MPDPRTRNPFWTLLLVTAIGFCVASLGWVAAGFDRTQAPLSSWMNRNGTILVLFLAGATLISGFLALSIDRRISAIRRIEEPEVSNEPEHPEC